MRWLVVLIVAAACGDGAATLVDAGGDAPMSEDVLVFPACAEFATSTTSVPARVIGQLGNADVRAPHCAEVNAPFGAESDGPDRVIPIAGLVVGMPYMVRLTSDADLAFYVATGCGTPAGPSADECLVFEDASRGSQELGRFVATTQVAYVIVDHWESRTPASTSFTLEVYAEECTDGDACSAAAPACFEGQCVACVTSFDCPSSDAPVCDAEQRCGPGSNSCTNDDATEPADDGPAGATPIVLDGSDRAVITGRICSVPRTEYDFFAFDVASLGDTWDLHLAWSGSRDLDLAIYTPDGRELGLSYWEQPEKIRLTYLPVGRYVVRVREFAQGPQPVSVPYTLTVQRTTGAQCTSSADCATEYRNQLHRGSCTAGACVAITGGGAVSEGGACDSQSDCAAGLSCPSFLFTSDADERATCARTCMNDADCAPLGEDVVCTTYLAQNFCVAACTEADHCPTSTQSRPTSGPWSRLRCDAPTGRCLQ